MDVQRDSDPSSWGLRVHVPRCPDAWLVCQPCPHCLELQVWDRGNSAGQFPANRALVLVSSVLSGRSGGAVLGPHVSWSCCASQHIWLPAGTPAKAHACRVLYFLPDCPNNVSERATENIPALGCTENPDSLFSRCLRSVPLSTHCNCEGSFQSSRSAVSCLARKIKGLVKL